MKSYKCPTCGTNLGFKSGKPIEAYEGYILPCKRCCELLVVRDGKFVSYEQVTHFTWHLERMFKRAVKDGIFKPKVEEQPLKLESCPFTEAKGILDQIEAVLKE